ncbi:MAG: hypothetical protein JSV16_09300, partial [Candidatus Hydrogenedentota bacterium]
MRRKGYLIGIVLSLTVLLLGGVTHAWTPKSVVNDELVRMPGTQPGQAALQAPTRCLNCHAG